MRTSNMVVLKGNLCNEPELKYTPRGKAVCEFSLAVNENYKNDAGKKIEYTNFFRVSIWGAVAESFCEHKHKGDPLLIGGKLRYEEWLDRDTNEKRSAVKIIADDVQWLHRAPARDMENAPM